MLQYARCSILVCALGSCCNGKYIAHLRYVTLNLCLVALSFVLVPQCIELDVTYCIAVHACVIKVHFSLRRLPG